MRSTAALLVLAAAACAPSSAAPRGTESPARVITAGESVDIRVTGNEEAMLRTIAASPEEVWRTLPQVFEDLGVPVRLIDTGNRIIGNPNHSVSRTLAGESLQRYLTCGSTMTGPITSTHDVRLSLLVGVLATEGGAARLQTAVGGSAYSRQGASGGPVACGSTGRLEQRVAEMVNEVVAG